MRIGKLTGVCIAMAGSMLLASPLAAEHWGQWRGPHLDGSSAESNLPQSLDPQADAAWTLELPGPSAGTPVIWGDRIFLGSLDKNTKKLLALCVNRADGKIIWQKPVGIGAISNRMNDLASPSPITD